MTRGEKRVLRAIQKSTGWVNVTKLCMDLGYSRAFVEKTADRLYWEKAEGGFVRMKQQNEWWFRP